MHESDRVLLEPYDYLESNPGKDFRSKMILAFQKWLAVPECDLIIIKQVISMLHCASLLIDDIEDGSELRRGAPVAHKIFGMASTINSANFVYFLALEKVMELEKPTAIQVFTQELLQLHRGQGFEIRWRDSVACPSEEEYLVMVSNSTSSVLCNTQKPGVCSDWP
ncbi:geranylgeranyl pyrophosphate synthetase [Kappamyces sp. JEL0680]|nr:geranylgeranyl pyrophosphate synthetase [Kappamyces sp. JEL0680]